MVHLGRTVVLRGKPDGSQSQGNVDVSQEDNYVQLQFHRSMNCPAEITYGTCPGHNAPPLNIQYHRIGKRTQLSSLFTLSDLPVTCSSKRNLTSTLPPTYLCALIT